MTENWRWLESRWTNPDFDWTEAKIITGGVDIGSVSTQAVVMCDGELYAFANMRTGSNSANSAIKAMDWALEGTGLAISRFDKVVGTGYGRVNVPFAHRTITEIACHGRGANFVYGPTVRTVLDMGGQDCKVMRVDGRGKVESFLMNDKCAAGTGRGMEVFSDIVGVSINDVGDMSLDVSEEPQPVASTCVVFAKSEANALLRQGWNVNEVLAAYCRGMAERVVALLQRIGVEKDFAITGGIAKNAGIVKRIERAVGVEPLKPQYDTQLAGAIGAALFAKGLVEREGSSSSRPPASA